MIKHSFLIFTLAIALAACAAPLSVSTPAQSPQEAVSNYTTALQNRDGRATRVSFAPQAMLHSTSGNSPGRQSSASFAATVGFGGLISGSRSNSSAMKSVVKKVDADTQAGVVRVDLDFGSDGIVDYLMVARIGEEWKIISKIFEAPAASLNTDLDAARLPINRFIASRTNWDVELFGASTYETAQLFTVVNGELKCKRTA